LPSKKKTKIKSIYFYDEEVQTASRRSSVTLTLDDEINISRGDMITRLENPPVVDKQFTAKIAWMDQESLTVGNKYVIQHGVNKVLAKVDKIHHHIKTDFSGTIEGVNQLELNDIALVSFKLNKPIFYDAFKNHRTNGSFIIIDPQTNTTAGAGFIQ
jgi:sulfate adenylyltransferase subunit 1